MKKYLWMSSAAVVTGALRVKYLIHLHVKTTAFEISENLIRNKGDESWLNLIMSILSFLNIKVAI